MQCPSCAAENPEGYRFCDACGEPLAVPCAQCGTIGRPGARFCGHCGAQVDVHAGADAVPGGRAPATVAAEHEGNGEAPEHYGELAAHCEQHGQWPEALAYALRAGDAAAAVSAPAEASEYYARALRAAEHLQGPGARLVEIYRKRAASLEALGEHEPARTAYEHGLGLARQSGDRSAEADLLVGLAETLHELHRWEPAERACAQALAIAADLGDPLREGEALAMQALCIAAVRGPIAEARGAARAALERSERVPDDDLRRRAVVALGAVLEWRADFEGCLVPLHEGEALAARRPAGAWRRRALEHLAGAHLGLGHYEQALRWYGQLARYADAANDIPGRVHVGYGVGRVHLELFDAETTVEVCREAEDLARRVSPWPADRAQHLITAARAELSRGDRAAADDALGRAASLLEHDGWGRWCVQIALLCGRAELALAREQRDDAWREASQALELATHVDARAHIAEAKRVLGEIAAAQDRLPEAVTLLRAAVTLAEHIHAAHPLWRAAGALGGVALRHGDEREAETHLTQAAQTIEAIAAELSDARLRSAFTRAAPVADVYRRLGHRPLP